MYTKIDVITHLRQLFDHLQVSSHFYELNDCKRKLRKKRQTDHLKRKLEKYFVNNEVKQFYQIYL